MISIITAIAAFLAVLWTLVQIVAYAREKDPRNIKIAILLTVLIFLGILIYPAVKRRLPEATLSLIHKTSAGGPKVDAPRTLPPTPASPQTAAGGEDSVNEETPDAAETGAAAVTPPSSVPPSPQVSPDNAPPQVKGEIKSSFVIDIGRTVIGGVGKIGARCTFSELGGIDVEMISYTLTCCYLESPGEDEPVTRSFERTLKEKIAIKAGQTEEKSIEFDSEIGDVVLKSRKSGKAGWIRLTWTGRDSGGTLLSSESTSNRPEN